MQPLCLVLSDDLLDASRVIGEGRATGLQVIQCKDQAALLAAAGHKPALVILDLHNPGLDISAAVESIERPGPMVVGFGSHVDSARLKAARQAGCDEVLPRSAFFEGLGDRLRAWTDAAASQ
jgi:AmiR/NasT family two-component response regulator